MGQRDARSTVLPIRLGEQAQAVVVPDGVDGRAREVGEFSGAPGDQRAK